MTSKKPAHTALYVLALCFALSVLGRGLTESFTVFLLPISQNFGWDRAEVLSIYSAAALISGLSAPIVGRMFDHSGPRTVFALGLALLGGALLIASAAQKLWQFQLCIGLCAGVGAAKLDRRTLTPLLGLRPYIMRHPMMLVAALCALVVSAGAMLTVPVAVRRMIDHGFSGDGQIDVYFAAMIGVGLVLALASAARMYLVNWLGERPVDPLQLW